MLRVEVGLSFGTFRIRRSEVVLAAFLSHVISGDDGQVSRSSNAPLRDFQENVTGSGVVLESQEELLCNRRGERGNVPGIPRAHNSQLAKMDERPGLRITTWNGKLYVINPRKLKLS